MDHSFYDQRRYPVVNVAKGYGEWASTYEQVVQDEMDIRLLDRLQSVDWSAPQRILDLACGTGRIAAWLKGKTSAPIEGIDLTPEMMDIARPKNLYQSLHQGDISQTGLPSARYDLCIQSLADEHLPELKSLYQEVARLTQSGGYFILAGYHPQFLMAGIPTHFDSQSGEPLTIQSYVHLLSDHVKAASAAGWSLLEMDEGLVDEEWLKKKPKWAKYLGLPISFSFVWRKP